MTSNIPISNLDLCGVSDPGKTCQFFEPGRGCRIDELNSGVRRQPAGELGFIAPAR
jgi:hypothetical protein